MSVYVHHGSHSTPDVCGMRLFIELSLYRIYLCVIIITIVRERRMTHIICIITLKALRWCSREIPFGTDDIITSKGFHFNSVLLGFPHLKYEKMYNDGYVNTVSNNQDLTPQSCPRAAKSSLNLCCGLGNTSISSMAVSVSRICV